MDKMQRLFLQGFARLCKNYSITEIVIINDRIHFVSNNQNLAFRSMETDKGSIMFHDVLTRQDCYLPELRDPEIDEEDVPL